MSFTTPTVDVYLPGTTLGIGNVNAGTINIGKTTTQINVGGPTNFTNSVAAPTCTMASLTTGNLIISPYSENVQFSNLSTTNAIVTNMSATNASFQNFNSTNILIGPYPQNGTFNTLNVTNPTITNLNSTNLNSTNINSLNASMNVLNVSNFLITPLNSNPTFATITVPHIDVTPNTTLHLGNQNATSVYIGSSGTRNVTNHIGTGSGTGTITIGNNTNSISLNGQTTLAKPLILGSVPTANTQLGYRISSSIVTGTPISSGSIYTFTPSLGTSTYQLASGVYIATLVGFLNYTNATSANADFQFGISYSNSTTPAGSNITGAASIVANITYNTITQNKNLFTGTVCFTATSSTNYYYAYSYVGLGSLTGTSPSVTTSIQMVSIIRIA